MDSRAPFALVFVAVTCATLLAGWRSGLTAVVIGQALTWFVVMRPEYSFDLPDRFDASALAVSTLCQLIIVGIVALYQSEIARHERVNAMLVSELNHRVKNTLAVVQSIAHQTLRDRTREEVVLFDGRLQALATAHNVLSNTDWNNAHLKAVVDNALAPFAISSDRITIEGPDIFVAPKAAVNLTLVIHELATNAINMAR